MSRFLKAFGAAASQAFIWATFVVNSPSGPITSSEWLLLGGAGLTVLAVWGVPNINNPSVVQVPSVDVPPPAA